VVNRLLVLDYKISNSSKTVMGFTPSAVMLNVSIRLLKYHLCYAYIVEA
jgi:hypothetical protein